MAAYTLDDFGNLVSDAATSAKNKVVSLFKSDDAPGDYSSRKASLARQQKLADMLSQMGAQEQAVSTVGGITAPVSPMGALARGLTSFGGAYLSGKAAADEAALEKAEREAAIKGMKSFYELPEKRGLVTSEVEGTKPYQATFQAPTLPGMPAPEAVTAELQMPVGPQTEAGMIPGGPRSRADQVRMANEFALGDNKFLAKLAPALLAQTKPEFEGIGARGTMDTNPDSPTYRQVIGAPPEEKTELPNSVREALWYKTATPEEKASFDAAKASGRPVTTIMMPKPANAFATEFGSGLAKNAMTIIETGKKAPSVISSANRVIAALSDPKIVPITGTFAEVKLAVGKALYGDTATYASTEGIMSDLASSTLDAIQGAGLGSGQGFSNTDRDFLVLAKAGKVGQTKENLIRLANLRKNAGIAAISMANDVMGKISQMPEYAGLKGLLQPIEANIPEYVTDPKTGQMILKTGR